MHVAPIFKKHNLLGGPMASKASWVASRRCPRLACSSAVAGCACAQLNFLPLKIDSSCRPHAVELLALAAVAS